MKTLFLVEDNPDNADLITDLLGSSYHLRCFADGPSVLAVLAKSHEPLPDLLLLDISLPGMDGTTLLLNVRSDPRMKHLPAIALTAHAMKSDREKLIAAGFNDYLSKPITDEQLLIDTIESHIPSPIRAAA